MQPGDVKVEVMGVNKWARVGLNGTVHALLTIDRPVRVEVHIGDDLNIVVMVFDGLEKQDGEKPVAELGRILTPDINWISHKDGSLTTIHRDAEGVK